MCDGEKCGSRSGPPDRLTHAGSAWLLLQRAFVADRAGKIRIARGEVRIIGQNPQATRGLARLTMPLTSPE